MRRPATIQDNVIFWLAQEQLDQTFEIDRIGPDRVYGWIVNEKFLWHLLVGSRWRRDVLPLKLGPLDPLQEICHLFHGHDTISFREHGKVRPTAQVCLHPVKPLVREILIPAMLERHGFMTMAYVEIDFDYWTQEFAPLHWGEVLWNGISRRKTNQETVRRLLHSRYDIPYVDTDSNL